MNQRQELILQLVKKVSKKSETPDPEESLFDSGYLDSFALPDLVAELEEQFSVKIPDSDLNHRKCDSIARIDAYLGEQD
jgi:acyl carrier protein